MTSRLPIAGYPHFALAAQDDKALSTRTLTGLSKAGFVIESDRIVPPQGISAQGIIAAITDAFQAAKQR
ncbi:MAG: hypothetical protein J0H65_17500 [Rhizobiales bacterium]|nr:hypothetical protein [Hyphomicrobiales bacterium]